MQRLEVSCAVRLIYTSFGAKVVSISPLQLTEIVASNEFQISKICTNFTLNAAAINSVFI